MEGDRLLGRRLGEREREVSEGVKDLFRSSPRPKLFRSQSLPYLRRGGVLDLLGVYLRRRGRGELLS